MNVNAPITRICNDTFKQGMRQLAAGVTIVSCAGAEGPLGLTATSVSSLSADPPSLLLCVHQGSVVLDAIRSSGRFVINVLREDHEGLAKRFAGMTGVVGSRKFDEGRWVHSDAGIPSLEDALVRYECRLLEIVPAATHAIITGAIESADFGAAGSPLVYGNGGFGTLVPRDSVGSDEAENSMPADQRIATLPDKINGGNAPSPTQALLRKTFDAQRIAFQTEERPDTKTRQAQLDRLQKLVERSRGSIIEALEADFGVRATTETLLADVNGSINSIQYNRKNLARWARPERRGTSIWFLPGGNRIERQPRGVVGIMSPWNYPVHLTLAPVAAALAAGNRVMAKMSETTPRTTDLLHRLVRENFNEDVFTIIGGDASVSADFAALPFDHLLFTGSTNVGRMIAKAAAENLTPVTLELGGKSPVIVDPDYSLKEAAERVAWGKLVNCGQTCVAPDYALVPKGQEDTFAKHVLEAANVMFPDWKSNADLTSIVDDRQYQRLIDVIEDARERGAKILQLDNSATTHLPRRLPLTLILGAPKESRVMNEELFGPILPILGFSNIDEAAAIVEQGDPPLALYYFARSAAKRKQLLGKTTSGGVTFNDTLLHYLQDDLPFGGVGTSGMGSYHGREGFDTFSHKRSVFTQRGMGSHTGTKLLYPPYGPISKALLSLMRRIH